MNKGIIASNGLAIGKVYKIEKKDICLNNRSFNYDNELEKLNKALDKTINDLLNIKDKSSLKKDELNIIDAHISMCKDEEFIKLIKNYLNLNNLVEKALELATKDIINLFDKDSIYADRVLDIQDVSDRILNNLTNNTSDFNINEEVIIVAKDLVPSITISLDKRFILGFVTEKGSKTSHTAIVARSLDLPAIVALEGIYDLVNNDDTLIIDAINNEVIINPSVQEIERFNKLKEEYLLEKEELKKYKNIDTLTLDNKHIDLSLNISSLNDFSLLDDTNHDGVGLYRTEFMYMNADHLPSEDEQLKVYKNLLEKANGKRVIIRTMDIGGDKGLPYLEFNDDPNPFLGYRAIRMSLDKPEVFIPQIRAILRASFYGLVGIMFPMIATVDEFKIAKEIVLKEKEKLIKEGHKISDDIQIGMMVEIPSSAVLADKFAKYADFFSIGTNDLIQYTLAQDRTNPKVSYLYQPLNPSLLKLIKMTIDGAHKHHKWCKLCGEIVEDEDALKLLIGLGIDEISLPVTSLSKARKIINNLTFKETNDLALKALELDSQEEVRDLLKYCK